MDSRFPSCVGVPLHLGSFGRGSAVPNARPASPGSFGSVQRASRTRQRVELAWRRRPGSAAPSIDALLGHTPDRDCTFPVPAEGTAYAGAGHRTQPVYPIMGKSSRAGSALFRMAQAGSGPTKGSDAARGRKPEDARGMSRAGRPGRGLGRLFSHCAGRQLNARRRVQLEDRCRRGSQRFTS